MRTSADRETQNVKALSSRRWRRRNQVSDLAASVPQATATDTFPVISGLFVPTGAPIVLQIARGFKVGGQVVTHWGSVAAMSSSPPDCSQRIRR
jgi:hypothetical protein